MMTETREQTTLNPKVRARIETAYDTLFQIAYEVDGRELTDYVAAVKPLREYLNSR